MQLINKRRENKWNKTHKNKTRKKWISVLQFNSVFPLFILYFFLFLISLVVVVLVCVSKSYWQTSLRANGTNNWQKTAKHKLTVCVFEGLLLFGGLGDDFDPLAEEDTDVSTVAVEHLDRQHEVLSLVGVGYVQGFGCAIILEGAEGEAGKGKKTEHMRSHELILCHFS